MDSARRSHSGRNASASNRKANVDLPREADIRALCEDVGLRLDNADVGELIGAVARYYRQACGLLEARTDADPVEVPVLNWDA